MRQSKFRFITPYYGEKKIRSVFFAKNLDQSPTNSNGGWVVNSPSNYDVRTFPKQSVIRGHIGLSLIDGGNGPNWSKFSGR